MLNQTGLNLMYSITEHVLVNDDLWECDIISL